ncbi:MAG: peptidylprolyl isomerase, partial [Bacteroidota bacterium]
LPIRTTFEESTDPDVRMALAIALGKTKQDEALASLISQYRQERDYRVKCNILRALSNFPYEQCRTLITEAIQDENEHVARRAVQYLLEKSAPEDAAQWWGLAKDSLPTPVQLDLYQVANRHLPAYRTEYRDAINGELRSRFLSSNAPYEKAACLRALAEFPWNYRFLFREGINAASPIVQSAAFSALQQISDREDFDEFFRSSARRVRQELAEYFLAGIQSKSGGMVAVAASALRNEDHDYSTAFDSLTVLRQALDSLSLPAQVESYNELILTINHLAGNEDLEVLVPEYNHPIDWTQLEDATVLTLVTTRGEVTLSLWPTLAPGSVVNFIDLARSGFFDNTAFHRVVPNFVIQGGSPSGDAYGSMDYSIRSEFTDIHYDEEGLLGMASAGPDTEGTQFFITHSPTLHLDGRYTVFGKVSDGMDVVHRIQVGDRITSIQER